MSNKLFYIYKITNKLNNKVYIGKSNNPNQRFRNHINSATKYNKKHECTKLYRSIRKYGASNFQLEILECFSKEKICYEAEIRYIKDFNSINCGLNITPGGKGGFAGGINHPLWGKKFTT